MNLNLNANSEEFGVKKLDTLESRAQAATEILDPIIRNFILDFEIGKFVIVNSFRGILLLALIPLG